MRSPFCDFYRAQIYKYYRLLVLFYLLLGKIKSPKPLFLPQSQGSESPLMHRKREHTLGNYTPYRLFLFSLGLGKGLRGALSLRKCFSRGAESFLPRAVSLLESEPSAASA